MRHHQKIKADNFKTKVLPTFRPDKAVGIDKEWFSDYVKGNNITSYDELIIWLKQRIEYFHQNGCRLADHGLDYVPFSIGDASVAFNKKMFDLIGPDTGFDSINDLCVAENLSSLMNSLEQVDALPKTILYTLNPKDNYVLGTMLGNFQKGPVKSKIQFGSSWWFNDNRDGMVAQMSALSNLGVLGAFVGMLTDSRSFVSYPRHEYFRRILCNLIGQWVENGEYPKDMESLEKIVKGISYQNAKEYFGF